MGLIMSYLLKYCIKQKNIFFRPGGIYPRYRKKIFLLSCNL
uniref:Uncharacterized protein n=1 Tax=Klebsiella pneumoniae TaxID=573 RepID=A0A8B0SU86_KLEPN|nr:hypothetical protein [Klebsiella pneumoniae]